MTREPAADDAPHTPHDEEDAPEDDVVSHLGEQERRALLTWVGENLTDVRRIVSGQRVLSWILWFALVIGLLAYVAGYALRKSVTTEPLELLGDLLYTLGYALWTGVVVVVFLQILPEANGGSTRRHSMPTSESSSTKPEARRIRVLGRWSTDLD